MSKKKLQYYVANTDLHLSQDKIVKKGDRISENELSSGAIVRLELARSISKCVVLSDKEIREEQELQQKEAEERRKREEERKERLENERAEAEKEALKKKLEEAEAQEKAEEALKAKVLELNQKGIGMKKIAAELKTTEYAVRQIIIKAGSQ